MKTAFSLVIPARNAARTIDSCLNAVIRSSIEPFEIFVVNDHSTDNTVQLASVYPCSIVSIQSESGPMAPRFAGARKAQSPILIFVDSDVCVRKNTFEKILRHFEKSEVDAVTGILAAETPTQTFCGDYKNEYMHYIFSKRPQISQFVYGSIWAVRKESLVYFEPITLPFGSLVSDTEEGLLLNRSGKKIILDSQIKVDHLKPYSLPQLLRNDFVIPFCFSQVLVRHRDRKHLLKESSFSHASVFQVTATALASVSLIFFSVGAAMKSSAWLGLSGITLVLFYIYWMPFFWQIRKRGLFFLLKAVPLKLIDAAVMFCGMIAGLIYTCLRLPTGIKP